jgi:predicted nucleotidyltransferase
MPMQAPLFYPKDFIETADGLLFAVVAQELEHNKVLCFLRYVREKTGWKKYATDAANTYLLAHHPEYLHYSTRLDAPLHAVAIANIRQHHQPRQCLYKLQHTLPQDAVEQDLQQLIKLLHSNGVNLAEIGVTGSLLVGVQNPASDIDLVCYTRETFQHCRRLVRELIAQGELSDLSDADWQAAYQRRAADISLNDYVWHERRKHNKALVNGRKFDLSLLNEVEHEEGDCQKHGPITLQCQIIDDRYGFDYPARFTTDHPAIKTIIIFTATYTGQACNGERIEVCGVLEKTAAGLQRVVVGANREAKGEYLKVLH